MASTSLQLNPYWVTAGWAHCGEILSCTRETCSIRVHISTRGGICTRRPICMKRPNCTKVSDREKGFCYTKVRKGNSYLLYMYNCFFLNISWSNISFTTQIFKSIQTHSCTTRPILTRRLTYSRDHTCTKTTSPLSCTMISSQRPHWEYQRGRGSLAGSKRRCRGFCLQHLWSCTKWVESSVWKYYYNGDLF